MVWGTYALKATKILSTSIPYKLSTNEQLDLEYFQSTVVTDCNRIEYERFSWPTQLDLLSQCFPSLSVHRINKVSCCSKYSDAVGQGWSLIICISNKLLGLLMLLMPCKPLNNKVLSHLKFTKIQFSYLDCKCFVVFDHLLEMDTSLTGMCNTY